MNDALIKAVEALPANRFAVLDGAHVDDLPDRLRALSLACAPLYLEAGNDDGVRAGPYLTTVTSRAATNDIVALIEDKPAATFWSWPGDFPSLRRHLRGLNLVEMPNEARVDPSEPAYETVLFRHWDPNVLAVTLPVLDGEQRSRLLGDSAGMVFDATDYTGTTQAMRPPELPPRPRGMLRFSPEQMAAITERLVAASHGRIAAYLRDVAPERTENLNDAALLNRVKIHESEALALGLSIERDVALWSYLQLISGAALFDQADVRRMFEIADHKVSASDRLEALLNVVQQKLDGAV